MGNKKSFSEFVRLQKQAERGLRLQAAAQATARRRRLYGRPGVEVPTSPEAE